MRKFLGHFKDIKISYVIMMDKMNVVLAGAGPLGARDGEADGRGGGAGERVGRGGAAGAAPREEGQLTAVHVATAIAIAARNKDFI